ncbi:MAG: hypothetical protein WCT04_07540 [Planctomycetota bacterium]
MNRLRTLAGIALIAGVFAGLSSCANKKGDLGAEFDAPPTSIAAAEAPKRSVLDSASPADLPDADTIDLSDSKNRTPQAVSNNRNIKLVAITKNAQDEKQDDSAKGKNELHLPDAVEGEVVVIADAFKVVSAPVTTTTNEVKKEVAPIAVVKTVAPVEKIAAVTEVAKTDVKTPEKVDVKIDAPKVDVKKVEVAPVAIAPVTPAPVPAKDEKIAVESKPEVKSAPKDEVKLEAIKIEDNKPEAVAVAPVSAPVKTEPSDEQKRSEALALLNKQATETAQALVVKPVVALAPAADKKVVVNAVPTNTGDVKPAPVVPVVPVTPSANVAEDDKNKDKTPPAPTPAPKPETPPVAETIEQRAARLLADAHKTQGVQREAYARESEAAYQTGRRLYDTWEYEKAKPYFERALTIDPTHERALESLKTVKSLLNMDSGFGPMMRNLANQERVKVQEQAITLSHNFEEARTLEARGSETVMEAVGAKKTASISERLRFLEQAQDKYRRMIEIINWMPPAAELPGLRAQADEALNRVRGKIDKYNEEIRFNRRTEAAAAVVDSRDKESQMHNFRISKMLEHVDALIRIHDYKGAEQMALRVLMNDPLNADAEKLKQRARSLAHDNERKEFKELYREEYRQQMLDNEEQTISSAPLIQYPAGWDTISKRSEVAIGRKVQEEPWKLEIRKKLQRKVALEFVDTQLVDVIGQLRSLSNVTMIVDPKVLAASPPLINLRVPDMSLDVALDWILKLAELEYVLQDHAVYIGKAQALQAPLEMRIYDVSDLTSGITDFPGPEFQITVAGDKSGGGGGGGLAAFGAGAAKATPPTNATIQEMIKTRIMPLSWDPATGASIEEKGGKLVVMQRPEIHKLIEQLLGNFRSTQKMMINIESRFLTIREAYLEQTGVEFQGLDPNVLFGDFGDIRRLGAPTGFQQPRVPGNTDQTPPNVPFPGLVSAPTRTNGGLFSTVGSIVNHAINFFPNDPSTISAQDAGNTVRQGGFSGQVTILNGTQMQAFIRALAVRENTSTLIAPRLTVFNTQRANMFVARQQSYVADYEISGDSYDPVVRQFLVGVVLDVKPIVSSDRKYVTLELRPTVTELTNFVTRQIDTFSVNSGAQVNVIVLLSFPIQFPELSIQKVRTTATVPDGGVMLIGGLYKNVKFNAENGVPFMSDLPVIGRLFRWNVVDNAKSNLAILISPRIILFNEEEEKLLR